MTSNARPPRTSNVLTHDEAAALRGDAWGDVPPPRDFTSCDHRDFARSYLGRRCQRRGQWVRLDRPGKTLHVFRCDRHEPEMSDDWTLTRLGPTPEHVIARARMVNAARFPNQNDRARWSDALRGGRELFHPIAA